MSSYKPLGGRIFTIPFLVLGALALVGFFFIGVRMFYGLGAVANMNGAHAWGIWVVYDVVIGTALACGGYALAVTIYILNRGQYHPLIRPALLASLLGYGLGGFGAFFDMGRWWQFYNLFLPWHMNFNSVMLEVALCVTAYILVLAIEFSPVVLERFGFQKILKSLNKVLFFIVALGMLLPTMHQSSLGSLLIAMGYKVHPLWQSWQLQPLLAIISALIMGFSIVIFESSLATAGLRQPSEKRLLAGLGKGVIWLLAAFLIVRFGELLLRGKLGLIFAGDFNTLLFLVETALFVIPLVILASPKYRQRSRLLLGAALSMILAGALYRFNAFLFAFNPGPGYSYFPSVPEILVTLGLIATEILVYLLVVKLFPVLHRAEQA